jgi:hypothetical protein
MNNIYIIIDVSELPLVHFDDILESFTSTLRYSLDGTKTVVKWRGPTPDFVKNLTTIEGPYTLEEILPILDGIEWTEPEI